MRDASSRATKAFYPAGRMKRICGGAVEAAGFLKSTAALAGTASMAGGVRAARSETPRDIPKAG